MEIFNNARLSQKRRRITMILFSKHNNSCIAYCIAYCIAHCFKVFKALALLTPQQLLNEGDIKTAP